MAVERSFSIMADSDLDYCLELTKRSGSNLWLVGRALPKARRAMFVTAYASMRVVDDFVDDDFAVQAPERRAALRKSAHDRVEGWRQAVAGALAGAPQEGEGDALDPPIARALTDQFHGSDIGTGPWDALADAMHRPAVDFSGPEFIALSKEIFQDLKPVFKTEGEVFLYAANGHGAWEAALANTLSPGDSILVPETGNFSVAWADMADALGLKVVTVPSDWRRAIDPNAVEDALRQDTDRAIKAVLMVHTDTATGITSDIQTLRAAIDAAGHPALFMDACSSRDPENWRLAGHRFRQNGIQTVSTEMVCFEWLERAGTDAFRELSRMIK